LQGESIVGDAIAEKLKKYSKGSVASRRVESSVILSVIAAELTATGSERLKATASRSRPQAALGE
jgi:hypothetical protein